MAYFNYFPTIGYDVRGDKNNIRIQSITNLLTRTRKKLEVTNNNFFDKYFVKDGDRPDILAHKFYGDSDLHWIILYANYMTNPWYDWPMTYFDLQKYVAKKYDDVNGIHHYIDEDGYEVDSTTANATAITNFVYEESKNDESRSINIPKVIYTQQIINELKDIM